MATITEALQVQIRGDSSHLLRELERSRQAVAQLRAEWEQLQQSVSAGLPSTNGRSSAGGMAAGGLVPGPSGTDRVPALLSAGEFVMSRDAVARFGVGFMQQVNALRFQNGGLVGNAFGPPSYGQVIGTQEGRLRFLGLAGLPAMLDEAVRLLDLGLRTGDPSFAALSFPLQQTLANFVQMLSQPGRVGARNALAPLDTELRRRPEALAPVLSLVGSQPLRLELLRLLGFAQPEMTLASLARDRLSTRPMPGSGTAQDPFRISKQIMAAMLDGDPAGLRTTSAPVQHVTNNLGGVQVNVRGSAELGSVLRELQFSGLVTRLRRGS